MHNNVGMGRLLILLEVSEQTTNRTIYWLKSSRSGMFLMKETNYLSSKGKSQIYVESSAFHLSVSLTITTKDLDQTDWHESFA